MGLVRLGVFLVTVRGVPEGMQDATVLRAWILYSVRRMSLREVSRALFHETQYANPESFMQAVRRQFIHRGLPMRPPSCGKARPPFADELVREMHQRYLRGATLGELADEYSDHLPGDNTTARAYHVRRAFGKRGLKVRGRGGRRAVAS